LGVTLKRPKKGLFGPFGGLREGFGRIGRPV